MSAPTIEHLRRTTRLISQLTEVPMRISLVEELLLELPPEQTVWCIDQVLRGAMVGHAPSVDTALALALWLLRHPPEEAYERYQVLFEAATGASRSLVPALLRHPAPHVSMAPGSKLPEVRLPMMKETSLGQRRSLARSRDRRILERLIYEPSPLVLEVLLVNPSITQSDVILIASRRPTLPELLDPITRASTWIRLHDVREALAMNPYIETGHALKLLPTLHEVVLRRLRDASDVHPSVKQFAADLLHLRQHAPPPLHM